MSSSQRETSAKSLRFSLVIPAYNEAVFLPMLLDSVDVARTQYSGGREAIEVIVGNNMSTDTTAEIALTHGCIVTLIEKRMIAAARNGGAKLATGEIICFIDADSRIHPDTFNAIDRTLSAGDVVVGTTGINPERWSLGIALTWMIATIMTFFARVDAGVVFCRRADFLAIGGYDETLDYAEDIKFLVDLKKIGKPRRQRFARTRNTKAITSMRKFDKHGDWHYFTKMPRVAFWMLINKTRVKRFTDQYWYQDR
jgi:glycosyltransferase involved in cell wall biosynthesis